MSKCIGWCQAVGYGNGDKHRPMGHCGSGKDITYVVSWIAFFSGVFRNAATRGGGKTGRGRRELKTI